MSEKKPQPQAKAKYQSKGLRSSGGTVPRVDTNLCMHGLLNGAGDRSNRHIKKAIALVARAQHSHRMATI